MACLSPKFRLCQGRISQGATRAEAVTNVQEAITAYLESLTLHNESVC